MRINFGGGSCATVSTRPGRISTCPQRHSTAASATASRSQLIVAHLGWFPAGERDPSLRPTDDGANGQGGGNNRDHQAMASITALT